MKALVASTIVMTAARVYSTLYKVVKFLKSLDNNQEFKWRLLIGNL